MPYTWSYDDSRASLYRPGAAGDFFSHGTPPSEAALAAELARLVYCRDRAVVDRALASATLAFADGFLEGSGTQWFLAVGQAARFLVFRGTETDDPSDIVTDANLPVVAWDAGGRVHQGFAEALDRVWNSVTQALGLAGGHLVVTGHSLGAALAVLAASRLRPDRIYTIGCPRAGDAEFVARQSGIDHVRFVHCCDLVTRIPPSPLFEHTGRRLYLDRNGDARTDANEASIAADRLTASLDYFRDHAWRPGAVAARDLADHTPVNYVSAIWGAGHLNQGT